MGPDVKPLNGEIRPHPMTPGSTLSNHTRPTMSCARCHLPILVEPWMIEHVKPGSVFCGEHQPRSVVDPATVAAARRRMAADQASARRARYRAAVREHDPRGGYDTATIGERGRPLGCVHTLAAAAARYRAGQSAAVVLCGPVGTGKTRAAFAVVNDLMNTAEPTPVGGSPTNKPSSRAPITWPGSRRCSSGGTPTCCSSTTSVPRQVSLGMNRNAPRPGWQS